MRILYLAGPGDIATTYQYWKNGQDDPSQIAITYSSQFFDFVHEKSHEALVVSYHKPPKVVRDPSIEVEHRSVPFQSYGGPMFHLGWCLFSFGLCLTAIRGRFDVLVLMTGSHLFPYWPARWLGKRIILSEQCVLWPKNRGRRGLWRVVHWLDRSFFRRAPSKIISMSQDITDQIEELTGGTHPPIVTFLPSYRRSTFADFEPPAGTHSNFRVLFAGRAEANKGVLDIVEMARRLQRAGRRDITFDIAGEGGALAEVRQQIAADGLEELVTVHGHCERPKMRELLETCRAVIVPTKAEMIEGFNKVVAEAVLAHRPYITSHLCPAVTYVRDAGIEVPPDDVQAYVDALMALADDDDLYKSCVDASYRQQEQFYDQNRSWKATLAGCLSDEIKASKPVTDTHPDGAFESRCGNAEAN